MKFVFMTTLYHEINPSRAKDFSYCFRRNCDNPLFEKMVILYDTRKGESPLRRLAQEIKHAVVMDIDDRPTFASFFSIANSEFPGKNILVCNSDIYYDDSLSLIEDSHLNGTLLALTRWTHETNGVPYCEFQCPDGTFKSTASADTWIFKAPLPPFQADFRLGVGNCDSRVAGEAVNAGLLVSNPCKSVKTFHVHSTGYLNDERSPKYFYTGAGLETPFTEIPTGD